MSNVRTIIEIAERNAYSNESARICLKDAFICFKNNLDSFAQERAMQSLKHSVGIFSEDYKLAKSLIS